MNTCNAKLPTNMIIFQKQNLNMPEHKRPKEIHDSYHKDYDPNNGCRSSPNIPKINSFQGFHIFIPPVAVVLIKIFSNFTVIGIFFHNFLAKFC